MRIAVPNETVPGEQRVALVPDVVPQLLKLGHTVTVEAGAGIRAGFTDEAYQGAGASIESDPHRVYADSAMVLKVQRPADAAPNRGSELDLIEPGAVLIGLLQ